MVSCFRSDDIAHRMDLPKVLSPGDPRSWPDKTHSTRLTSHTRGLGGVRTEAGRSHQEPKAQTKVREAKARKAHTPGKCAGRRERRQHHGESIWEKLTTRPNLPAMPRQNRGGGDPRGQRLDGSLINYDGFRRRRLKCRFTSREVVLPPTQSRE